MKKMKKLVSLAVAMLMVFTMNASVFATGGTNTESGSPSDGNFTLTIGAHDGGDADGYVYNAYQIFKGNVYEVNGTKTLSNIEWGDDVNQNNEEFKNEFANKTAEEVAKSITSPNTTTNENDTNAAKEFAAKIAKYLKGNGKASQANTKNEDGKVPGYTISNLSAGYYLVQNSAIPNYEGAEVETADAFTRYILQIVGNASATPKSDVPTSDKKIINDKNEEVDVNNAAIGDTVNYLLKGTLPSNFDDFKTYYYVFNDNLSKGLTINNGEAIVVENEGSLIKVELVNGRTRTDVSKYFYRSISAWNETTGTTIKVGIQDLKALNNIDGITVDKDTVIEVTYAAIVNNDAEIGKNPNTNDVMLDFSNNPNNSGEGTTEPPTENPPEPTTKDPTGKTPTKEVETYVTELTVLKVDEGGNVLKGAGFTLTSTNGKKITLVQKEEFVENTNGDYWKLANGSYTTTAPILEDITDEDGNVVTKNNKDKYDDVNKKYKLTKTLSTVSVPTDGKTVVTAMVDETTGRVTFTGLGEGTYTLEETTTPAGYNTCEKINFSITFSVTDKVFISSDPSIKLAGDANKFETTIENKKGSLLPSTGGIGTTIFYVVGTVLVLGAAVLLITKKRMKAQ